MYLIRTIKDYIKDSTAEYACSSWGRSRHTGHVDIALNETCRIITGCLKATPIPCLYALAGIAPPHIRRKVATNADRCLHEDDPRHPLHGQRPAKHRLTSRNSFLDSTEALNPLDPIEISENPSEILGRSPFLTKYGSI